MCRGCTHHFCMFLPITLKLSRSEWNNIWLTTRKAQNNFIHRIIKAFSGENNFMLVDAFPAVVPLVMFILGGSANVANMFYWYFIIFTVSSFWFGFIGLNAGHHHPDILHEGDAVRWFPIRDNLVITGDSAHFSIFEQRLLWLWTLHNRHNYRSKRDLR